MHVPPCNVEKFVYLDSGRLSLYTFGAFSTFCLLTGNVFFVLHNPGFWPYALFVALTIFYLLLTYTVGFLGRPFDFVRHKSITAKWFDKAIDARVDVFLPVCREDFEIIKNTWAYVLKLKTIHPNLKIHVLDDGKDDRLEDLAKKCRLNYIRRETNVLKKAGNLRHAFRQTDSEFILIIDADFTVRDDILIETLPYFFEDKTAAIVQTPQKFSVSDHRTWIGRGTTIVQELFYRLLQTNRDTFNAAICTGTNAVYRRSALEPFGGTAAIPYSEDMRTSFMLISNFWRVYYLPINLAKGLCPDDLKSFFVQQMRWSLGSISLFFSKEFWVSPIDKMQRISYLTGILYYISTGLSVLFAPLPSILLLIFYPEKIMWFNLLFSVPSLIFSTIFMKWWIKEPFEFSVLRSRQVSYFSHLYALKDYLFDSLEAWVPTGDKTVKSKKFESFKIWFPILCIGPQLLTVGLLVFRIHQGFAVQNFTLLMLFMAFNAFITFPILKDLK